MSPRETAFPPRQLIEVSPEETPHPPSHAFLRPTVAAPRRWRPAFGHTAPFRPKGRIGIVPLTPFNARAVEHLIDLPAVAK